MNELVKRFEDIFGPGDSRIHCFFAPGRVNLIGDHTDYTGGLVFPCAITQGTRLLLRANAVQQYRLASCNFDYRTAVSTQAPVSKQQDHWVNYPLGVIDQFIRRGVLVPGFDLLFSGDIPNGAGLSSSASVEVVTAFALHTLLDLQLSLTDLVQIAWAAENEFVGMQCGIMDQFAVTMAQADHAIQLDCATRDYRQVPFSTGELTLLVSNTNQRRELSGSAYNERVAECRQALEILRPLTGIKALGQLRPEQLDAHVGALKLWPEAALRARHVCEENARVRSAVSALESGDFAAFGRLMSQSHASLRDLYRVSSDPLDHLVTLAKRQTGVLGSRLTGAGFGGCTVTLLDRSQLESFTHQVSESYYKATGLKADFYEVQASDGVRQLAL